MGDRVAVMRDGQPGAGRHAAASLRAAREPVRRGLHRLTGDEPPARARRRRRNRLWGTSGCRSRVARRSAATWSSASGRRRSSRRTGMATPCSSSRSSSARCSAPTCSCTSTPRPHRCSPATCSTPATTSSTNDSRFIARVPPSVRPATRRARPPARRHVPRAPLRPRDGARDPSLNWPPPGGIPERSKGTGCKPVGSAFAGSNPAPTISSSSTSRTELSPSSSRPCCRSSGARATAPVGSDRGAASVTTKEG